MGRKETTRSPASVPDAPEIDTTIDHGADWSDHNDESGYPLTPVQEAMLFHSLASEAEDLYIVQQRIEITGPLDVDIFRAAWRHVIHRHPALRAGFSWSNDKKPVQLVYPEIEVPIEVVDLTDTIEPDALLEERYRSDRKLRYELDRPPLMRIVLFRITDDRSLMLWSQHHLLQDGWSASNVLGEVFSAYSSIKSGEAPGLEPVRPFHEYIEWLDRRHRNGIEAFWRDNLSGFFEPTRMSRTRREGEISGYRRESISLTPEMTRRLGDLAVECAVTLNVVLMAGLAVVLGRYQARTDVVFGIVAAGRPAELPGIEAMVGMFINTLVMRVRISPEVTVSQFLQEVQEQQSAVLEYDHSSLPEVQRWSELGSGTALTDVLFAFWDFGGTGTTPDGDLEYRTLDGYGRTSFPFSITVEGSDPLRIGLDFDLGEFHESDAVPFLHHYTRVLESMAAAADARVGRLDMLSAEEHDSISRFNETSVQFEHSNLLEAFKATVRRVPDSVAIAAGDRALSYSVVARLSDALALRLLEATDFKPPRVALLLPRSIDLVVSILGVLKAGGAYVPLEAAAPKARLEHMIADSGSDLLLTRRGFAPWLGDLGIGVIEVDSSDEPPARAPSIDIPVSGDDLAYLMYTSGSTGRPKGVMVTHRNLANYVFWAVTRYSPSGPSDFPLYTSIGFDLTVTSIFVPLVTGGRVVVYGDTEEPIDVSVLKVFEDDRVDVVKLTPAHLSILGPEHLRVARIRTLILGGEDLKTDLARRVVEVSRGAIKVFNEYGPTEATVGCMIHEFDPDTDTGTSVPIGRPIANTSIYVGDPLLSPVPAGHIGEIQVGGVGVAAGYAGRSDLTDDRFVDQPDGSGNRLYRTGDLGRVAPSGLVEYAGRVDDQVKVRGYRIEPGEIESVLRDHEAVADAAVAVRKVGADDVRLVAYYVLEPGRQVNVTALRAHMRARLPDFMVPQGFHRIEELPMTANGKVNRRALPTALGEGGSMASYMAPVTAAEHLVAEQVSHLLSIDQVGMNDNFFDLGGHSVLAMQLISRIHDETGMRIRPRVILLDTLGQTAALLSDHMPGEPAGAHARVAESSIGTFAYFFGPSEQPLFAIRYSAHPATDRNSAVLLCPPLGWEYMRTHWALRKLARQLAADGHNVLRFDYFGTGDSSGHASQASVDHWVHDIKMAAAELVESTGLPVVSLVGVRLGGTLAALACGEIPEVKNLVLWDPIIDGNHFLQTLEQMHKDRLAKRKGGVATADLEGDELLGFALSDESRRAIANIDLSVLRASSAETTVVASQAGDEYLRLADSALLRLEIVPDFGAWDEVDSTESALLPISIPARIVELLGAGE